jgi:uncharacterized protein (TIGR03437 family)
VINHNTVVHGGDIVLAYGAVNTGFVFTNNIFRHNTYGIIGQDEASGNGTINRYFPGSIIKRNIIAGANSWEYPADNYYPATLDQVIFNNAATNDYSLASTSPYKGLATDGKDIGYDASAVAAAMSSTFSATPTPTPTPSAVPTPTPTPAPTPASSPTIIFSDNFNDNLMDATKWSKGVLNLDPGAYNPDVSVLEQNQRLELKPISNTSVWSHNGYVSTSAYDLKGARATIQVLQAPTGGTSYAIFAVGIDSNNWYRINTTAGQIYFTDKVGGVKNSSSLPYDAAQHKYWRIRHEAISDMIIFETSADGVNWVTQRSVSRQLSLSALRVELDAGTYEPTSTPGTAIFDNFILDTFNVSATTPTPTPTPTTTPTPTPTPAPTPALSTPALVATALASATTLAGNVNATAAQIAPLVTSIQQAYSVFSTEASRIPSAAGIDNSLLAALYFASAASALDEADGASLKVQSRLQIAASYLSQASSLLSSGNNATADGTFTSHASSSLVASFVIGPADTRSSATLASVISPASLGTIIGDPNQSPLATQTVAATQTVNGKLPYELAGVSVMVGGRAAQVLSVSPSRVSFLTPAGLAAGNAEVIVTLQAGYVSRGTVTVAPVAVGIFTKSGSGTGEAMAVDSVAFKSGPFDVNSPNTSSQDKRTRLTLFTTGITSAATDTNTTNDLKIGTTTLVNLAEAVTVEAHTADGRTLQLPVEFAGTQDMFPGLDQVNVVLLPELKGAGSVELTLIIGGQRSNTATVNIK